MIDIRDKGDCLSLEEVGEYVNSPVFTQVCSEMKTKYCCSGGNDFTPELREIHERTKAGNGQKWLIIDLEDKIHSGVFQLLDIRRG